MIFLVDRDFVSLLPGDIAMTVRRYLIEQDPASVSCSCSLKTLLTTAVAIGASSLPLYAIGYHQGASPVIGAAACFLLGAVISAALSARTLDRTNRDSMRGQRRRLLILFCFSIVWTMVYFRLVAPSVVAALSLEPYLGDIAGNTYAQTLKPIGHITLAFAMWSGFQLMFLHRAVRLRERLSIPNPRGVRGHRESSRRSIRSMVFVLFTVGLGALYPWLLLPCFIAVVLLFCRFQGRLA